MFTVRQTQEFQDWLDALTDFSAQVRIAFTQARDIKQGQRVLKQLGSQP